METNNWMLIPNLILFTLYRLMRTEQVQKLYKNCDIYILIKVSYDFYVCF